MKRTIGIVACTTLMLGVAGGVYVAVRSQPRHPSGRSMAHSQRPDSQSVDGSSVPEVGRLVASESPFSATDATDLATDWSRFRGPNGTGHSSDASIPSEWSDTQNLRWKTRLPGPGSSSPVLTDKHVFLTSYSGYGDDERAKGQMSQLKRHSSYVVTPVLHEGHLYWIDDQGMYFCVSAKTGETVDKQRVSGIKSGGRPVYASPVSIHGKLFMQTRNSGLFVLEGSPKMQLLKQNRFESDSSVFNATPAVDKGQLFLRSYTHLYCVMADKTNR